MRVQPIAKPYSSTYVRDFQQGTQDRNRREAQAAAERDARQSVGLTLDVSA